MDDILSTSRLLLRSWRLEDVEPFAEICADPRVMQFIREGTPWSRERTAGFVTDAIFLQSQHGYCRWAMVLKEPRTLVGFCGYVPTENGAEIGWRLAASHWGQGLAFEAARAALDYGFATLRFPRVTATVQAPNIASRRLAEKLGMTLERSFERDGREVLSYFLDRPLQLSKGGPPR